MKVQVIIQPIPDCPSFVHDVIVETSEYRVKYCVFSDHAPSITFRDTEGNCKNCRLSSFSNIVAMFESFVDTARELEKNEFDLPLLISEKLQKHFVALLISRQ